jgi:hypothetical protein
MIKNKTNKNIKDAFFKPRGIGISGINCYFKKYNCEMGVCGYPGENEFKVKGYPQV